MTHKMEIDGAEVEVYTAAERDAAIAETRTTVEGEWKPKLTQAEAETVRVNGLLEQRAKEFAGAREGFQKLSAEQQTKLTATELQLYKNQETLAERDATISANNQKAKEAAIDVAIKAKVGSDATLFTKVKDMYALVQLEDLTPEQINTRVSAAFGAIGQTSPDLLAAAGFGGGGFQPPVRDSGKESFADTERGQEIAKALGLIVEAPKK